jgi:hypothetical protein
MSAWSNPGKMSSCETSRQTRFRTTNFSNGRPDFGRELREIMWSEVFSSVAGMRPHELHWIELWYTGRKGVNVQTRFSLDKVLDQASLMNGMVIPDQDDGTRNTPQELFEEQDHMLTTQIHSKRSHRQLYLSAIWTNQKSTKQIQASMVVQASICTRRLATRCPTSAKWRNE